MIHVCFVKVELCITPIVVVTFVFLLICTIIFFVLISKGQLRQEEFLWKIWAIVLKSIISVVLLVIVVRLSNLQWSWLMMRFTWRLRWQFDLFLGFFWWWFRFIFYWTFCCSLPSWVLSICIIIFICLFYWSFQRSGIISKQTLGMVFS